MTKRILTQKQAEDAYTVMSEADERSLGTFINGADYSVAFSPRRRCVRLSIKDPTQQSGWAEYFYSSLEAFADTYAMHYGLTSVEPESTIDRMVREAKARLAFQLDCNVAMHSAYLKFSSMGFVETLDNPYDRLLDSQVWPEFKSAKQPTGNS